MAEYVVSDTNLTAVANAIRTKSGGTSPLEFPNGFVTEIGNISGGGDPNPVAAPKDVNFIDMDGTIRYSYTNDEIANLTALPANPVHTDIGLVAQGWNWTLADIKTQKQKMPKAPLFVGQCYNTVSDKAEIDIEIYGAPKSCYINLAPNGTVDIDWGDGSEHSTLTGTSTSTRQQAGHTYPAPGAYTIKLDATSGTCLYLATSNIYLLSSSSTSQYVNLYASRMVMRIRHGNKIYWGNYTHVNLKNLDYVATNANQYAYMGGYTFENANLPCVIVASGRDTISTSFLHQAEVKYVSLPKSITTLNNTAFQGCNFPQICLPHGITTLNGNSFSSCNALKVIYIPETVTSIVGTAFNDCRALYEYHFLGTTPPSLSTNSGFTNKPGSCKFYVPKSENKTVLNTYKTASNWSTFASIIEEEP